MVRPLTGWAKHHQTGRHSYATAMSRCLGIVTKFKPFAVALLTELDIRRHHSIKEGSVGWGAKAANSTRRRR
jgi:hypothetical protein